MEYLYAPNDNYEDYASGRVIYHKSGFATFPVRLASELFQRGLSLLETPTPIKVYDPLCGEGYLLTIIGLLHPDKISQMVGSDINPEALAIAKKNLELFTWDGLQTRKEKLTELFQSYQKDSHKEALESVEVFLQRHTPAHEISFHLFRKDILSSDSLREETFTADFIISDIPYGQMTDWQGNTGEEIETFLANLIHVLDDQGLICLITPKSYKITSPLYDTLQKLTVGKRKIFFLRKK